MNKDVKLLMEAYSGIIKENTNNLITGESLGNIFVAAYKTLFDTDDIEVAKSKEYLPPDYCNQYFYLALVMNYKVQLYKIYFKLFYRKFPENEIKGLSHEEYYDMLAHAKEIQKLPKLNKEDIRKRNPLIDFTLSVYAMDSKEDDYFDMDHLGSQNTGLKTIMDVVEKTREIINKRDKGDSDDVDYTPPVNAPTSHFLVGV